jgi:hypothetical protein
MTFLQVVQPQFLAINSTIWTVKVLHAHENSAPFRRVSHSDCRFDGTAAWSTPDTEVRWLDAIPWHLSLRDCFAEILFSLPLFSLIVIYLATLSVALIGSTWRRILKWLMNNKQKKMYEIMWSWPNLAHYTGMTWKTTKICQDLKFQDLNWTRDLRIMK